MITLSKDPKAPPYSFITGSLTQSDNPPRCILSHSGKIIESQILDLNADGLFEIFNHVIMPDHVHILWRVREWLLKDFGYYVGLFKSRCTKIWRETSSRKESLFLPEFNDSISFDEDLTRRFYRYISDNPRRRLIVKNHPDLFQSAQRVKIVDKIMDCYGNFQLLQHPLITAGIISSRYTSEERERNYRIIEETIRGNGVLISPFISQEEKSLMHRAIREGASIIRIVADGITDRYKPSGLEFELCSEGRCLHIGEHRASDHKETKGRREFLAMNALARWIATHPAERMHLLKSLS